jgi:hypothetical protein
LRTHGDTRAIEVRRGTDADLLVLASDESKEVLKAPGHKPSFLWDDGAVIVHQPSHRVRLTRTCVRACMCACVRERACDYRCTWLCACKRESNCTDKHVSAVRVHVFVCVSECVCAYPSGRRRRSCHCSPSCSCRAQHGQPRRKPPPALWPHLSRHQT